jgi:acetate kinase
MRILVLNCGSSTLKFQLIEVAAISGSATTADKKLARGIVDSIGGSSALRFEVGGSAAKPERATVRNHQEAVGKVIAWLESRSEQLAFAAVGHRVVHGGDRFKAPVRIDDDVIKTIESLAELAPLHNPSALSGIRAARSLLGTTMPMVAAFDTTFHSTIPDSASTYAIPYEISLKHRIRRYGFHGLAHQYSALRYGELTATSKERINIVTLHLGNGCSACAVRGGESVDTSMGFTPLEGLVMGTRSGDLDPALVGYLGDKEKLGAAEIEILLNQRAGFLGLSGLSNDMRELISASESNPRARLAIEVFCHRARKYLGAYLAVLGGADAVIFSGGIGENAPLIREKICAGMAWCGLDFDSQRNSSTIGFEGCISSSGSRICAYVIPSDEEALIARETAALMQAN